MAQTSLSGAVQVAGADILSNSSVQQMALGAYAETSDGRGFRYAKVGATATIPGKIYAAAAWDVVNQAPAGGLAATGAINTTTVTVSTSTTMAANLLAGGYLVTALTPGQGYTYRIKSNTATAGAAGLVIELEDPLVVALTTGADVVLVKHAYDQIIVSPGGASTGMPVGVATTAITAAYYGWVQTFGTCAVLAGVSTSVSLPGVPVTPSASTAGSTIVSTAILPTIGWAQQLFTATEYNIVYLLIH